jgi:hypothetical protein
MKLDPRLGVAIAWALLATACGTRTAEKQGLIDVRDCEACQLAYEECQASGDPDRPCDAMMEECFAECEAPDPGDGDCGCEAVYDACLADGEPGEDPDLPDDGDDGDDPGRDEICEQIYGECRLACDEPPPTDSCASCEAILEECWIRAQDSDDPIEVLRECAPEYVSCTATCGGDPDCEDPDTCGGDDPGDEGPDAGGDACAPCHQELEACGAEAEQDDDPETNGEECQAPFHACLAACGGEPPPDDPACLACDEEFEWCVASGDSEEGCAATWEACRSSCHPPGEEEGEI